jgi:hypothetical protein
VRNRGVLLLALAIAAVLAAGSIFALLNAGDDSGPKVDALPTTSPAATETPSPTASPTPTETATSSPEPTATATAAPTTTRTSTSKPTTSGTTYAYPRPTRRYEGLQMSVDATNEGDGDADPLDYTVTVHATDGDGTIYFNGLSWGDGTSQPAQANPQRCKSYPPLTSPAGPYDPQNDSKTYVFHHHYPALNKAYTITVKVASVNVDCRPHGPAREDQHLSVTVHPTAV